MEDTTASLVALTPALSSAEAATVALTAATVVLTAMGVLLAVMAIFGFWIMRRFIANEVQRHADRQLVGAVQDYLDGVEFRGDLGRLVQDGLADYIAERPEGLEGGDGQGDAGPTPSPQARMRD